MEGKNETDKMTKPFKARSHSSIKVKLLRDEKSRNPTDYNIYPRKQSCEVEERALSLRFLCISAGPILPPSFWAALRAVVIMNVNELLMRS